MKRAEQRRYAILGALHEHGEMNATELARILGYGAYGAGGIYADLVHLEERQGLIVKRMAIKDGDSGRRMYWRIADEGQRRRHLRRRTEAAELAPATHRMPRGTVWQPAGAS